MIDRAFGEVRPEEAVERPFFVIPEGGGVKFTQNIGGKSPKQLEAENKATGREVTYGARNMLLSDEFDVLKEVTPQVLLKFPVRALGLPGTPTTTELYERIPQTQYGDYVLELSRAEVGPHLGIEDKDQPVGDYYYVMHKPITDSYSLPSVFGIGSLSFGRLLDGTQADPDLRWDPDTQLVVTLRKIKPVKP